MTTVTVRPLGDHYFNFTKFGPPQLPPMFTNLGPEGVTDDDIALARELFKVLDERSQGFYRRLKIFEGL